MPLALVSGASIAGTATAFWLNRIGWDVVLLERAPAFRDGGQNIDVRGTGRDVLDRMGLTEAVRARNTTEVGTRFVDEDGKPVGEFPAQEGGDDGPTAELEILRGDLASVVADALPDAVEWVFGETIASIREDESGPAQVQLAGGRTIAADLVVVAEGVRSTTRELVFGDAVETKPLGVTTVYGTIPRTDADDLWWRWFTIAGSRQAMIRPDPHGTARAMLAYLSDPGLEQLERDQMMADLRGKFDGVGWEVPRILDGFATSDDVYVDYLTMVRMPTYSRGRVVVTGDAAWSVTPLGGGGASLALVGAYVLAAFLSQQDEDPGARDRALAAYEEWMRPMADNAQDLPPGVPRLAYPSSRIGVAMVRGFTELVSKAPFQKLVNAIGSGPQAARELPELRLP